MYNKKIKPVLTEKSLKQAKNGLYTFIVDFHLDKNITRTMIEKLFNVHVISIKSMNYRKSEKKNYKGIKQTKKAIKKVIVSLKDKEKIDIFEEKGKWSEKTKKNIS